MSFKTSLGTFATAQKKRHTYPEAKSERIDFSLESPVEILANDKKKIIINEIAKSIKFSQKRGKTSNMIVLAEGAGKKEDFLELFKAGCADAGLAASIFHFKELSIADLKQYLNNNDIEMRI